MRTLFCLSFGIFLLIGSSLAFAGTLSLSTYYPSPTGNFDKISANNVGIGTSSPQTQLELADNSALKLGAAYLSSGGGNLELANYAWWNGSSWTLPGTGALLQFNNQDVNFFTHDTSGFTPTMHIASNGNVGIADSNPAHKLSISGLGSSNIDLYVNGRIMTGDTNEVGGIWVNGGNTEFFGEYDATRMGMYNGAGGWGLLMNNAGNVGVGVSSPTARLEVADNNAVKIGSAYLSSGGGGYAHLASNAWYSSAAGWTLPGNGALLQQAGQNTYFYTHDTTQFYGPWLTIASSGNVGVYDSTPAERLDIGGNVRSSGHIYSTGGLIYTTLEASQGYGQTYLHTWGLSSAGNIYLEPEGGGVLYLASSAWNNTGYLYIDFANAQMNTSGDFTISGNLTAAGYYYPSDKRLKKDIHPIVNSLDKIKQLQGVDFTWRKSGEKSTGLIAQDVEKVLPQLVKTDAKGMKSVEYGNIVALLIEAVKAQQKQIDVLNKRVTDLEKQQKTAK